MSDDTKDPFWQSSYEVGYGKPPVSRRFVKGKSGNPRGRPKKSPSKPPVDRLTRDRFLSATERAVTLRDGDNFQKVPLVDAVMRAESIAALKGNTHAQKNFLEREARYRNDLSAEIREDHEFWRKYAAAYEQNIAALSKAGLLLTEDWLHPDDLVFEDGSHVRIRGGDPLEATQSRKLRTRFRDTFILQAEKDRRDFCSKNNLLRDAPIFTSEVLVVLFNSSLPKRLQLDDPQLILRLDGARTLKKRELEQQLRKDWADLGISEAQNLIMPPIDSLLVALDRLNEAALPRTVEGRIRRRATS